MTTRYEEIQCEFSRSEPFFLDQDGWYFSTRENVDLGPFRSEQEAQMARDTYIDAMTPKAQVA
jgi:hypothetical protein